MNVIAIMSPGDMGHAVGRELKRHGLDVIACLRDRSPRTQALCQSAGIRCVENMRQLVEEADLILSILVPANAEAAAMEVAQIHRGSSTELHYVDCNAVSPQTVKRIETLIRDAGGYFTDASIIGFPPGTAAAPRLYVSGPRANTLGMLDGKGISVKWLGLEIGQASGLKMCYAAQTKGTFALYYALLIAAERMNLLSELIAEFESSQAAALRVMQQSLPRLPAKSGRWVGEMEQIAAAFAAVGVTPQFHAAAADIYRTIGKSSLGRETPESIDLGRSLEATIAAISEQGSSP